MSVRDEIETLSAALKHFHQRAVHAFKSGEADPDEVEQLAQNVEGDHPLVKDAIGLAHKEALLDADVPAAEPAEESVPESD